MTLESQREDAAYARSQPPILCRFVGGILHGTKVEVPLDKHNWEHKASGQEWYRVCEPNGAELRYFFLLRGLDPLFKNKLLQEVALLP